MRLLAESYFAAAAFSVWKFCLVAFTWQLCFFKHYEVEKKCFGAAFSLFSLPFAIVQCSSFTAVTVFVSYNSNLLFDTIILQRSLVIFEYAL